MNTNMDTMLMLGGALVIVGDKLVLSKVKSGFGGKHKTISSGGSALAGFVGTIL
jgi:long-subunit acyl-CoA synthetase (AMP-forming)